MATKVSKTGNILVIDDSIAKQYYNAAWCSIRFNRESVSGTLTATSITITNDGSENFESVTILLSDFQDVNGTPISTEATILTYLSTLIG